MKIRAKRTPVKITRAVLFALMLREIRGKFGSNRLGAFWFLFEPLGQLVLMLSIFSLIRAPVVHGVPLLQFLANGIVPFVLFKNIALTGMQAVNANRGLFAYRQIQAIDMIFARTLVECVLMAVVYALVLFSLSMWVNVPFAISDPLHWLLALSVGVFLSFSLAVLFCIFIAYFPELSNLIRMAYLPLYLISGVIFPISVLPDRFLSSLLWNPYLHIIEILRGSSIPYYRVLHQANLTYPATVAVVLLFCALGAYRINKERLVAA